MHSKHRNQKERRARLLRLLEIMQKHVEAEGEPVKLNGGSRRFDMLSWDCGTSACAFGSYALSPYGKKHFTPTGSARHRLFVAKGTPGRLDSPDFMGFRRAIATLCAAAEHFNISQMEAENVFIPHRYSCLGIDPDNIPPKAVVRRIKQLLGKYEQGNGDIQVIKRRHMERRLGFIPGLPHAS